MLSWMRQAIRCGAIIGILAALLATSGARAEPPAEVDRKELEPLLRAASDAAKKKDYPACIEALSAALKIEDTPVRRGDLGVCEEAAGRDVDAYRDLEAALRSAGADQHREPFDRFVAPFSRVSARVVHVFLAVDPPHAGVIVDGRPLGRAEGRSIILLPGKHTFAARLAGYADEVRPLDLEAGQRPTVHLGLKPLVAPLTSRAPAASSAPPPSPAPKPLSTSEWLFARPDRIVLVSVAGLGLLTAITSGATAIGLEVDRASMAGHVDKSACYPGLPSRPALCGPIQERAVQSDTSAWVTLGAALLATAGAAGVLAFARSSDPPSIAPAVTQHGGGIVFSGAW